MTITHQEKMAGSPTLVDWKTALASGVKIGVLLESLNNTKQPEAGKESPTTDINLPPDQFGRSEFVCTGFSHYTTLYNFCARLSVCDAGKLFNFRCETTLSFF